MAEDLISIGIALDTSKVLQGSRQVDTALKQVATTSTTTAQATQKIDAAARTAGAALTAESTAAQAVTNALRQEAQASGTAASQTEQVSRAAKAAAAALQQEQRAALDAAAALHKTGQEAGTSAGLMQRLGASVGDFGRNVGAFALAQAGLQGLQGAFNAVKETIIDVVKTGLQLSQLRGSFAAIAGGVTAGNREFTFAVDTANKLGVGVQSLAEQYRSLSAATRGTALAGADTRAIFVALTQAAQSYGLSTEQLGRAMAAVQQIVSKGKVSMEELRGQLAEALPGALQITARAFGTNTEALEDMVAKGMSGVDWARRFTAQLSSEIPPAAERAGKGFAQLGNEILLLKDYIAQSGLLSFLDAAARKAAAVARGLREIEEARQGQAAAAATEAVPKSAGVTLDKMTADDRQKLLDISLKLKTAEQELLGIQTARAQKAFGPLTGLITTAGAEKAVQARIDALRAEQDVIAKTGISRAQEDQRARARQQEIVSMTADEKALQRDKNAFLEGGRKLLEGQRKETEQMVAATKVGLGREPTAEEKVRLQEKFTKDRQQFLQDNSKLAEQYKDDPVVKSLRAQGQAQEAASKALEDGKKASQAASSAASKAASEAEAAEKKKQQALEETARLDKQQADEVGRVHAQSIESLRQLNAKYTEAKTETDADRASKLAASLAYSQHTEEANKLAEAIGKATQALEDQRKVEAKLPGLREEAQASKSTLDDLTRLQKQLEPSRRGMSTEERLAGTRAEIAAKSANDPVWLEKADTQIKETLSTELWDKWRDAGLDAFDHVGKALEEFVFKGKLNFKDLLGSIAQDIFRASLSIIQQQATKKGGWLEMGLNLLQKVPALLGGGPAPTTSDPAGAFHAQHGGPVSAGSPYIVGEVGPELFVPRMAGTIVPNNQLGGGTTVVNVHVSGVQDAQSFVQSRGAVSRAMMGALTQARQQM